MRRWLPVFAALLSILAWLASPREARAEVVIGAEARAEVKDTDAGLRAGPTALVSVGYAFDTYPILLAPEVAVAGGIYPHDDPLLFPGRIVAGARFGFTTVVEPQIFAHVGYGFIASKRDIAHGFALDAGFGLDYRLDRDITVGGVLGYEGLIGEVDAHGVVLAFRLGFWL